MKTAPCPRCGQPAVLESANAFRPFCSERCKLLDLARWADGTYRVPCESIDPDALPDPDDTRS